MVICWTLTKLSLSLSYLCSTAFWLIIFSYHAFFLAFSVTVLQFFQKASFQVQAIEPSVNYYFGGHDL